MMAIFILKKIKKFYYRIYNIVNFNEYETNYCKYCYYDNYNFLKCLDMVFEEGKDEFDRKIPIKPFKILVMFNKKRTSNY